MRIFVLSKRQYTGKDLLDDQYGRLYEVPKELARLGHEVTGVCLNYRSRQELYAERIDRDLTSLEWYSFNVGRLVVPGLIRYLKKLKKICLDFNPDILYACSDAPHIINGFRVARRMKISFVADLYDNFESFKLTQFTGMLPLFKRAVREADGVVCVSRNLQKYVEESYKPQGKLQTISNGIPTDFFLPMDRKSCRKKLGLPIVGTLIGTAGALGASRGIDTLFNAYKELAATDPTIHLVLAGPLEKNTVLPSGPRIHYLGNLDYSNIPLVLNTLDLGIVCNVDTSFGRYCFPQKAYEMLACQVSVVAANVGAMEELFTNHPERLFAPGNPESLAKAINCNLGKPVFWKEPISTWSDAANKLDSFFRLVRKSRHC